MSFFRPPKIHLVAHKIISLREDTESKKVRIFMEISHVISFDNHKQSHNGGQVQLGVEGFFTDNETLQALPRV